MPDKKDIINVSCSITGMISFGLLGIVFLNYGPPKHCAKYVNNIRSFSYVKENWMPILTWLVCTVVTTAIAVFAGNEFGKTLARKIQDCSLLGNSRENDHNYVHAQLSFIHSSDRDNETANNEYFTL